MRKLSDRPDPDWKIIDCTRVGGVEWVSGVGGYEEGRTVVNTLWHTLQLMREAKGSASNYTKIMTVSRNHGNSSHPAHLPPPPPHPSCCALILLHSTETIFFFFFPEKIK